MGHTGRGGAKLFYWLHESQHSPSSDGKKFKLHTHAWNQVANMLYLDGPVGTGYSYTTKKKDHHMTDEQAGKDNYHALQSFLKIHPKFKGRPVYIAGESYGGVLVPMFASAVIQGNSRSKGHKKINLSGIVVGNGQHSN